MSAAAQGGPHGLSDRTPTGPARRRLRSDDPVVIGHPNPGVMTDRICALVLKHHVGLWWWIALGASVSLLGVGIGSVGWLFYRGTGVWGVDWPVAWGFAIINYVWWIAIASGGTFVSALFYLTRVEWRTAINRIAETMMLCAAACAGVYPILHLGRPWFFYWLFPYPNTMTLWPQFRSPLLWDFMAILAYVISSALFWYFGLLPDFAALRDRATRRGQQVLYGVLAFGFRGTRGQWRHYKSGYGIMAALMAPLVVSVHSVVGLDFAGAQTVGWHSTQFPPFFVFGALLSGIAMVVLLLMPLRHVFRLDPFITGRHFDVLGRLLLASSFCMAYAYIMDAFSTYYGVSDADRVMFDARIGGSYAYVYWSTIVFNVVLPQALWVRRWRSNQPLLAVLCLGIIVGMWFERFEIVVTSLHRTDLPSAWGDYAGSVWDWTLMAGTVGLFGTAMLLLIRIVPIISIAEMRELLDKRA